MNEIIRMNENTWRIEDNGVRFFVLEGKSSALMIDSGMNSPDAKLTAESITGLPLRLLNTHADPDHISGNSCFSEALMSADEEENYRINGGTGPIVPVADDNIIDLGGRKLRIIALPGHTPGSIAVLDEASGILFGGDAIQDGRIFMFGKMRDIGRYIGSLEALLKNHGGEFSEIYPSHGNIPVSPAIIPKLIEAAEMISGGKHAGQKTDFFGREIYYHDFGFASFLCNK